MKYKYIFFDWGYTLISKFKDVDNEINNILNKYKIEWDKIFNKWKCYQILVSLGRIKEEEMYKDLSIIFNIEREDIKQYFKKIVVSEQIKERKPNLKIYLKAFEDIPKSEYEKVAFISDELLEDLVAVKILGIKTIWFEQNIDNKWKKKEEALIEPDYRIKNIEELLRIV